jgi:hypothetical protein
VPHSAPTTALREVCCGIDLGGRGSPSFVAWLSDKTFSLDLYVPTASAPLPVPTTNIGPASYIAVVAEAVAVARANGQSGVLAGTVGQRPVADAEHRVIREGFIVAP